MKTLEINKIESIRGGDFGDAVDGFCVGFGLVAGGYAVGVAANWWNPVGWTGAAVGAAVGVGCAVNAGVNALT